MRMYKYTIKKKENGDIFLLDEEGNLKKSTDILLVAKEKRVFAFEGSMGAGKTTFIKKLCEEMGTEDVVNSPTFAIVNVYEYGTHHEEMYHFDCYRIKDIREAIDFGAEEYLYSGNYCFIEWPDMIRQLLPEDTVWITIRVLDNGDRELTINL